MSDNKIGKLTTFPRLMAEESVVMIPKVQRDYAYGRKETKVEAVLDGMLHTMLDAVKNNEDVIFDFVYGGSYVKSGDDVSGLIPLDGQQRLTTLFLLYFYASLVQHGVTSEDVAWLKKFRYETRQSATDFCETLIDEVRDYLLEGVIDDILDGKASLAAEISGHPKYMPSYDSDPTIESMLNVLERIDAIYKANPMPDLWTRLMDGDNIRFYALSLDKFGLSDDIYIKMNSRGKKLTPFEIFKSDLEKAIAKIDGDLKRDVANKLDNAWMDIVWDYANPDVNGEGERREEIVRRADDGYMQLINNILRLELFRRDIEPSKNRPATIDEIFTDKQAVEQIVSILDTISDIHKSEGGIATNWYKYFYFSEAVVGEDNKIRLFWDNKNRKPVIHLALERDLSVPELIYFYALHLINSQQLEHEDAFRSLRVVRNLVNANVRANRAPYNLLHGYLMDVEHIIETKGYIQNESGTFIGSQWAEERNKANDLPAAIYDAVLRFENHDILRGSLALFMSVYQDPTELNKQLKHFETIVGQNAWDEAQTLRSNLLDKDIEYMQASPYMLNDQSQTKRFFVHRYEALRDFFISNEQRRLQENILQVIAKIPSADDIKPSAEKCKDFSIYDWQYYMAKYPDASYRYQTQGCYTWDNKADRPLELILLNSQSHSQYNIEWKLLNLILVCQMWDNDVKYSLDSHASSPMTLNKLGVSLDMKQEGWQLVCRDKDLIAALKNRDFYAINPVAFESEENVEPQVSEDTFIVNFANDPGDLDYIDLAIQIIVDLEAAAAAKSQIE